MTAVKAVGLLAFAVPSLLVGQECAPDNAGITVPEGFCVVVVAEDLGRARHMAVASNGDIFVAVPGDSGGVYALRDADRDGHHEVRELVIRDPRAAYVRLHAADSWLYYGTLNEIIRYPRSAGRLAFPGPPDTIVRDLPGGRQHGIKTFTFGPAGELFVNIGAPSNSCQENDRQAQSPGMDPCPLRDSTAGIWVWHAHQVGQGREDGRRHATGLRNTVALTVRPVSGRLYGVVHGRDMLSASWAYSDSANAEKPAEEFFRIDRGDDFGWPYCHYDPALDRKVLAPEYGGDGTEAGRCADTEAPLIAFPAHWGPNGITFYDEDHFPAEYRGGAFIAFHGSWNRAPLPQEGFNVVFVPFERDRPGEWRVFAAGFREQGSRPVDVVVGPDGSLYVSADPAGREGTGRIYRILYRG